MYTPSSFQVTDLQTIHAFMREHSFATIISAADGRPSATHLPFVVNPEAGEFGTLYAHMARANPLWKSWTSESEALVIFTGPHAYISPGWYHHQETVPTWNYSAVHVYGRPRIMQDKAELRALITDQVALYEAKESSLWNQSLMDGVVNAQLGAIVGFTIEIERFEGKFKFNQNRSPEDQAGVSTVLQRSGCPFKRAVGSFMSSMMGKR